MTTPTDTPTAWAAWLSRALELAEDLADERADVYSPDVARRQYANPAAARAALAAHLELVPMGEPFRWHWQLGAREGLQTEAPAPADHYSRAYVFTPLYRHPKESA